jgi:hypothetical protein
LNADDQTGSLLTTFYENHGSDSKDPYYSLLHPLITINNSKELEYIKHTTGADRHSSYTKSVIDAELGSNGTGDLNLLTAAEAPNEAELINVVTQTDTPMQAYLNQQMSDKVS